MYDINYEIKGIGELRDRIKVLTKQRDQEWKELKTGIKDQVERLKPSNFIRNAFEGVAESISAKPDIIQEGVGLAAGLIVNSVMARSKNKGLKKWLKLALYYAITYFVTRHREEILAAGKNVVEYVSDRLKSAQNKDAGEELLNEALGKDE